MLIQLGVLKQVRETQKLWRRRMGGFGPPLGKERAPRRGGETLMRTQKLSAVRLRAILDFFGMRSCEPWYSRKINTHRNALDLKKGLISILAAVLPEVN